MDKKYNAVKTLKQLDLSRGSRSSLSSSSGKSSFSSSSSGKSNFSSKSKEDRFNEAYLKDFSASPPAKAGKVSPPKEKTPPKAKSPKDKILNPLTGKLVGIAYYKSLVKSGKIEEAGVAKKESPKPESPKTVRKFYKDVVQEITDYLTVSPPPNSTTQKLTKTLLKTIKKAYAKEKTWDYMKKEIEKVLDDWRENKEIKYEGNLPRIKGLRQILIKYGYWDILVEQHSEDWAKVGGGIEFIWNYF
jgi:hypothetical protein